MGTDSISKPVNAILILLSVLKPTGWFLMERDMPSPNRPALGTNAYNFVNTVTYLRAVSEGISALILHVDSIQLYQPVTAAISR
jgi:hypothetical protein